MKSLSLAFVTLLVGCFVSVCSQDILQSDFEFVPSLGGSKQHVNPTDLAFLPVPSSAPDHSSALLLVTNRFGILTVSRHPYNTRPEVILDIRNQTCENGERGLLSVTRHPKFGPEQPYIYLFYTFKKHGNCLEDGTIGPVNRISRFTVNFFGPNVNNKLINVDRNSEWVLLETPSLPFDHHNAGDLAFGPQDGYLYATLGDAGIMEYSQQNSNLFGTIVRLNATDGSIPPTNPYSYESGWRTNSTRCYNSNTDEITTSTNNTTTQQQQQELYYCQEIFAHGFRNPFRLAMNHDLSSTKTQFHVNDVGASLWEEISVGGTGYEGHNYGWPDREGPCRRAIACGDCNRDDTTTSPIHFYHHNVDGDGAITAGVFVPKGVWPQKYDGMYLWADFVFGTLYGMNYTGDENRITCPIRSNWSSVPLLFYNNSAMVSMDFGPPEHDGRRHLYILLRGLGSHLARLSYIGDGNRNPQAQILTSTTWAMPGTTIWFDATATTDPDGDSLEYAWDFNGNGTVDSTRSSTPYIFTSLGMYTVSLVARDGHGGESNASIDISIGPRPNVVIKSPVEEHEFMVGEELLLVGDLVGENQSNVVLTWEVRQHHSSHYHPFLSTVEGNNIRLQPAPSPEDLLAASNSYLEVLLTATDSYGLKTTVSRNVMPKTLNVLIDSYPAGTNVFVDGHAVKTPTTIVTWVNHPLKLEATVFPNNLFTGESTWSGWSNGVSEHSQVVTIAPDEAATKHRFAAFYELTMAPSTTAGPTTTQSPTLMPSQSPTGKPSVTAFPSRSFEPTSVFDEMPKEKAFFLRHPLLGRLGMLLFICLCAIVLAYIVAGTSSLVERAWKKKAPDVELSRNTREVT